MQSSFRPRGSNAIPALPGTKISIHNGLPLASTGVPSLDDVLGGGIPLGSIILIKQDRYTEYAQLLLKYFLAQGVVSESGICLVSADHDPAKIMTELMGLSNKSMEQLSKEPEKEPITVASDRPNMSSRTLGGLRSDRGDKMSIAWRYQNLPQFSSSLAPAAKQDDTYCAVFDLTKRMDSKMLEKASSKIKTLAAPSLIPEDEKSLGLYGHVFSYIRSVVQEGGFIASKENPSRTLLRIAIDSFASAYWPQTPSYDKNNMVRFLSAQLIHTT